MINMDNKAKDSSGLQWNICPQLSVLTVPSYYQNWNSTKSLYTMQTWSRQSSVGRIDHYLGVLLFLAKDRTWREVETRGKCDRMLHVSGLCVNRCYTVKPAVHFSRFFLCTILVLWKHGSGLKCVWSLQGTFTFCCRGLPTFNALFMWHGWASHHCCFHFLSV